MARSLSLTGPLDEELLHKYIIPALRDLAITHKHDPSHPLEGGWVGRAKVCELAADHLDNLLSRNRMMCHMVNSTTGRRRVTQTDLDNSAMEWLDAMEREANQILSPGVKTSASWRKGEQAYSCSECGEPIEPGDYITVAKHSKGIIHKECEDLPQQM